MSDNKMENVSIKERAKQLKAVRSILRGEEVQKTVMVGYNNDCGDSMSFKESIVPERISKADPEPTWQH